MITGELALDGTIRPVRGVIGKLLSGRARGFITFYLPFENLRQAKMVPDIGIIPIRNLGELHRHLNDVERVHKIHTNSDVVANLSVNP
jgi:magnesium chelatase family protein